MKVLVIGSKGFLGKHVSDFFRRQVGHEVFGCDVMVDYGTENYFLIDVTNADYHDVFQEQQFDACINCSGAASVPDSLIHPMRDYTLNAVNVFKLLDAIRQYQSSCKFINLSSAAVYGNPESLPIHEKFHCAPISPYGLHKMQAEQICLSFYTYYAIPTCSLRVFSAFGEGLKKQLFWDLYQKAKNGNDIELFGTGLETRDFIHSEDVSNAILCCLNNADFKGEAINIANGEETSISHAVETFYSFFGDEKRVRFNGKVKKGDPLNWRADIRILKEMGYKQSVSLTEGLEKYFQWISQL